MTHVKIPSVCDEVSSNRTTFLGPSRNAVSVSSTGSCGTRANIFSTLAQRVPVLFTFYIQGVSKFEKKKYFLRQKFKPVRHSYVNKISFYLHVDKFGMFSKNGYPLVSFQ